MKTIDELIAEVLQREGGFVDDPDDPGGATNFGVTIHTLKTLGIDINGDGAVDRADVKGLDDERAAEILKENYFRRPGIWRLPEDLQPSVFDMYVNAGSNAIRILQSLVCKFGVNVAVDGALGPKSAEAVEKIHQSAGSYLADAYAIERRNYYYSLADRRPPMRKYACTRDGGKGGWIKRAEAYMSARFQFSAQEHARRVSEWG